MAGCKKKTRGNAGEVMSPNQDELHISLKTDSKTIFLPVAYIFPAVFGKRARKKFITW
jgi:hypothetical protein